MLPNPDSESAAVPHFESNAELVAETEKTKLPERSTTRFFELLVKWAKVAPTVSALCAILGVLFGSITACVALRGFRATNAASLAINHPTLDRYIEQGLVQLGISNQGRSVAKSVKSQVAIQWVRFTDLPPYFVPHGAAVVHSESLNDLAPLSGIPRSYALPEFRINRAAFDNSELAVKIEAKLSYDDGFGLFSTSAPPLCEYVYRGLVPTMTDSISCSMAPDTFKNFRQKRQIIVTPPG